MSLISECPLEIVSLTDDNESETPIKLVSCYHTDNKINGFPRILRLSSNGDSFLASTEDNKILSFPLSNQIIQKYQYYVYGHMSSVEEMSQTLSPSSIVDAGESIYDIQYKPKNHLDENSSNLYAITTRAHPIQLCESLKGSIVASYVPHNHLDELDVSISLSFNNIGDKLYAGSDSKIHIFDLSIPGQYCTTLKTNQKNSSFGFWGQKGIISVINFNPDYSGLYAAGSFSGCVSIYTENSDESCLDIANLGFGVSHVKWSPCGRYLWVSGRRNDEISCWDIRGTKKKVGVIKRSAKTQQRNYFDIDPWGKFIMTGSQEGDILIHDTQSFELVHREPTSSKSNINSCVMHPYSSLLITAQGERSFSDFSDDSSDNSSAENFGASDIIHELASKRRKLSEDASRAHGITIWSMRKKTLFYEETANQNILDNSSSN